MAVIFWDASGLIKRYFPETGSDTADAIFAHAPTAHIMATTPQGYAETYASLLRKKNSGTLDQRGFETAITSLQAETVDAAAFALLPISPDDVFASIGIIHTHNLNSTDAAILTVLLNYTHSPGAFPCPLVAADRRLLRAAQAEGLATLDPEQTTPEAIPALLAALA